MSSWTTTYALPAPKLGPWERRHPATSEVKGVAPCDAGSCHRLKWDYCGVCWRCWFTRLKSPLPGSAESMHGYTDPDGWHPYVGPDWCPPGETTPWGQVLALVDAELPLEQRLAKIYEIAKREAGATP